MNQCIRNIQNGFYYGPEEKYEILNQDLLIELEEKWKFKSRIIESLKIKKSR